MEERRTPLPIEGCRTWFTFLCPKTWSQLERTKQLDVRYCSTCRRDVFFCDSLEAVEEHRRAGRCICVQAGVEEDATMYLGEP